MRFRTSVALAVTALVAAAYALSAGGGTAGALGAPSNHLVVIVMENKERSDIVGKSVAPYINHTLIPSGRIFNKYYAIAHPSLPNYLALTSGSFQSCVTDSCPPASLINDNLFHQLGAAAISWKVYAESMSGNCAHNSAGDYLARHNPAIYYNDLTVAHGDGSCSANDVPYSRMATDLANHTLPAFSWIAPNQYHDMHTPMKTGPCVSSSDTNSEVCQGDLWLKQHVPAILSDGGANDVTLLVLWDEGSSSLGGGGHALMIEIGPGVCAACVVWSNTNDYGVLTGIEDWFGLSHIGPKPAGL